MGDSPNPFGMTPSLVRSFSLGMIVMWFGSLLNIPENYVLCNGENGTPDLRDRFIVGAGGVLVPGTTGGGVNHEHDFTTNGHIHRGEAQIFVQLDRTPGQSQAELVVDAGAADNEDSRPPYHSLAYIMQV